jgi:hypothetical protein
VAGHRFLSTALFAVRAAVIKTTSDDFVRSLRAEGGREGTNITGSHMATQMITISVEHTTVAIGGRHGCVQGQGGCTSVILISRLETNINLNYI